MVVTFWADASSTAQFDNVSVKEVQADNSNVEILGSELVTNGTFATNLTGWTPDAGGSWVAGELKQVSPGSANGTTQGLVTTVGRKYRVSVEALANATNTTARSARFILGGAGGLVPFVAVNGVKETLTFEFTATGSHTISLECASDGIWGANGDFATFDNVSVKEVTADAISYFPSGVPMINDRGYHAYGALTNYILHSQNLANAAWLSLIAGTTATSNAGVAPDGTGTATRVQLAADAISQVYQNTATAPPSTARTVALFVKSNTGANQTFRLKNTEAGVVDYYSGVMTATASWQRFAFAQTHGSAASQVSAAVANNEAVAKDLLVWQCDVFAGNFPDGGPIIPTTATTASIGESLLKQNAKADGTALTDVDQIFIARAVPRTIAANQGLLHIDDGTIANRLIVRIDGGFLRVYVINANVATQFNGPTVSAGTEYRVVVKREAGTWRAGYLTGSTFTWIAAAVTAAFPPGMVSFRTGSGEPTSTPLNGEVIFDGIHVGTFTDAQITTILGAA